MNYIERFHLTTQRAQRIALYTRTEKTAIIKRTRLENRLAKKIMLGTYNNYNVGQAFYKLASEIAKDFGEKLTTDEKWELANCWCDEYETKHYNDITIANHEKKG